MADDSADGDRDLDVRSPQLDPVTPASVGEERCLTTSWNATLAELERFNRALGTFQRWQL